MTRIWTTRNLALLLMALALGSCGESVSTPGEGGAASPDPGIEGVDPSDEVDDRRVLDPDEEIDIEIDVEEEPPESEPAPSWRERFKDVPGLPEIPVMSGDRQMDKAALGAALAELQTAWETNRNAQKMLEVRLKQTGDSDELQRLLRNNEAYQLMAEEIQRLVLQVGEER